MARSSVQMRSIPLLLLAVGLQGAAAATATLPQFSTALQPGELPSNGTLPLTQTTYRLIGSGLLPITADLMAATSAVLKNLYSPANLTVDVLRIYPTPSAPVVQAAPGTSMPAPAWLAPAPAPYPDQEAAIYSAFTSVEVVANSSFSNVSSYPSLGSAEGSFRAFLSQLMAARNYKVNVISVGQTPEPQALPILARMQIDTLRASQFVLQVQGYGLLPFDVQKQSLLLLQLAPQLNSQAGTAYLNVTQVSEAPELPGGADTLNVTVLVQWNTNGVALGEVLNSMMAVTGVSTSVVNNNMASAGLAANVTLLGPPMTINNFTVSDLIDDERTLLANGAKPSPSGSGLSSGAVAGISVAAVVGAALVTGAGAFLLLRRRRSRHAASRAKPAPSSADSDGSATELGSQLKPQPGSLFHVSQQDGAAGKALGPNPADGPDPRRVPLGMELDALDAEHGAWAAGHGSAGMSPSPLRSGMAELESQGSSDVWSSNTPASSKNLVAHKGASSVHCWDLDPSSITFCKDAKGEWIMLGRGAFGAVYKAMRSGVQEVAVKILTRTENTTMESRSAEATKEISIQKTLSFDKHIVQFYGACLYKNRMPMLVLEYMAGGDLRSAMSAAATCEQLRWYSKGRLVALDIVRGLVFLHNNKVQHGDVKSPNVLLGEGLNVAKIGDVGLARIMDASCTHSYTQHAGTFAYAAPEILLNQRGINCSADIYSFGVLLWELVTHEVPVRGHLRDVQVPQECPAAIAQIIEDCLEVPAPQRPTAEQLFHRIKATFEEGEQPVAAPDAVASTSGSQ